MESLTVISVTVDNFGVTRSQKFYSEYPLLRQEEFLSTDETIKKVRTISKAMFPRQSIGQVEREALYRRIQARLTTARRVAVRNEVRRKLAAVFLWVQSGPRPVHPSFTSNALILNIPSVISKRAC